MQRMFARSCHNSRWAAVLVFFSVVAISWWMINAAFAQDEPVPPRPPSTTNPGGTPDPLRNHEGESDAAKTIYNKSGQEETEANPYGESGKRERPTFGKHGERMVVIKSAKPPKIEKTKFGSADATVATGVFKGSLLDTSIDPPAVLEPRAKTPPAGSASAEAKAQAQPSVSPKPSAIPGGEPSPPQLGLSLGVSTPAPGITPRP